MDGLWDPPFYQANEDTMSFCLPYDVIEETNLNERCCIQVLDILISKADTDIVELEEELMDLLSQLVCTDEVFSDMFSMSLRAKVDFLDSSIRKLKDDDENFSSTNREPAESIYDILKSLFCRYLQKKDLQSADKTGIASSSFFQVPADTQKKQIGSFSNANEVEKVQTVKIVPVEKQTISPTLVKVNEEHTNYPVNINDLKYAFVHPYFFPSFLFIWLMSRAALQHLLELELEKRRASPAPKYHFQSLCWGSTKKTDRQVNKIKMKSPITMTKDIVQNRTPKRKNSVCSKPSLETQGKRRKHPLNIVKSLNYDDSMGLVTVPDVEPSEESNAMSLVIVPDVELYEESNAMSLATIPYVESSEETNAKQIIIKEIDFPPGYPKPQHHHPYSTRTYTRRKRSDSPLQTVLNPPCRTLVAKPLDRAETYSNLFAEDYYYTVSDLRAIAKQRKIKHYYKLRKAELAQVLGMKLIEGKRKQPKIKETTSFNDQVRGTEIAAIGF